MSHVQELTDYLITNYYSKSPRQDIIPTPEQIETAYANHQNKFIIVRDDKIKGVAAFLTLTDETYELLESLDITRMDILKKLLAQVGPHVHFVLLCADGYKTIVTGMQEVKRRVNPKTISWWNPDFTHLHQFKVR